MTTQAKLFRILLLLTGTRRKKQEEACQQDKPDSQNHP
jgi:hypothetical protein